MDSKVDDRKMTKFTKRDCNLMNLLGMFQTCLDAIELCLDDGNVDGAKHRIMEMEKGIKKLMVKDTNKPKGDR
jgi:hypothetical protein